MKAKDIIISALIGVFFIVMFCVFILKSCEGNSERNADLDNEAKIYYLKYNIKLKGVIVNKVDIDSRYSTYTIKVVDSNVNKHDVREFNENYYLVIFGDSAKMVDSKYCGQINDSIIIDYSNCRKVSWNTKGKREDKLRIFSPMYCDIRKQGLGW